MNDENTESTTLTLGQTLKSSREQANVSLEELAKNLKLSVLQLQRLENDEHQLIGPATFVKGYAKSYCRAFNLDTAAVLALFPEPQETVKKTNMQSFSRRTEKEAHDSRLMLVSYVILAIVIGSSALWWWQNSTPLDEQVVTQSLNSFAEETVAVAQAEPQNDGLGTIVMHFNEESWVEIHDGKGDKVAFGVKKAGYDMTVSGHLPFSIVLGKHQAVDITLDGEKIDISSFPKNRLAKFNLPLTE